MEENSKFSRGAEGSDENLKGNIRDLLIEYGREITVEDKLLASKEKNAVDFVMNYSKQWCKCIKETIRCFEKRAIYENECMRATVKLYQGLASSVSGLPEAPMPEPLLTFSRLIVKQAKETELHNAKRYRELLEVLKRQKTEFEKTREVLKAKWKVAVKRMVDAESCLFKAKGAYFSRCQTGVKLREELSLAQATLDDSQAILVPVTSNSPSYFSTASATASAVTNTATNPTANGTALLGSFASTDSGLDTLANGTTNPPSMDSGLMNTVTKQRAKVEKLEKQLGDNDKKEMELMYAYRESVEVANARLVDLEKSKVEIICDTRLSVRKFDEIVSDSMADLISHLFVTRTNMLSEYEDVATMFQNYMPGQPYHRLLQSRSENGVDIILEKYQFEGYHDNPANARDRNDDVFGKFVSRFAQLYTKDTVETLDGRHSDSDSEADDAASSGNTTVLSSIVQFGSNLFKQDPRKANAVRAKARNPSHTNSVPLELDPTALAALEAALEVEFDRTSFVLTQCINGIEGNEEGLKTHGIYRVSASKIKVTAVVEALRIAQESEYLSIDLSNESPITLASTLKSRLIQIPEPLLTFNLYDQFVAIGKSLDSGDSETLNEQTTKLAKLIDQLSPANRRIAGLLFHHLRRVASFQSVNQMGAFNLATMFGPTVLRQKPKFNVANMMEFMDNNWLAKVVELCIDRAPEVFGPESEFTVDRILKIIRDRAAESKSVDMVTIAGSSNGDQLSVTSFSAPVTAATTSCETFFTDEDSTSTEQRNALRKPVGSRTVETSNKPVSPQNPPMEKTSPRDLSDGSCESCNVGSSSGSGLKHFLNTKALNLQQRFQNMTCHLESNTKSAAGFGHRKLISPLPLRDSPNYRGSRLLGMPQPPRNTPTKTLDVPGCAYIDNSDSDS